MHHHPWAVRFLQARCRPGPVHNPTSSSSTPLSTAQKYLQVFHGKLLQSSCRPWCQDYWQTDGAFYRNADHIIDLPIAASFLMFLLSCWHLDTSALPKQILDSALPLLPPFPSSSLPSFPPCCSVKCAALVGPSLCPLPSFYKPQDFSVAVFLSQ